MDFIGWFKRKRKIFVGTVRLYFSSLRKLATLRKEWKQGEGKELERGLLRGYQNLGGRSKEKGKPRKTVPVDLKILDEIRRGIKTAGWAWGLGICVWSACLLAFWGFFRLGEIFARTAENFDKFSDFLWKDVKVKKGGG
jgi:hypothetical protein